MILQILLFSCLLANQLRISESEVSKEPESCGCPQGGSRRQFRDAFRNPHYAKNMSVAVDGESVQINGASYVKSGDMILDKDNYQEIMGHNKFRAYYYRRRMWPNNTVPYILDDAAQVFGEKIERHLNTLSQKTDGCVKFQRLSHRPSGNYIKVIRGDGCYSKIGMTGGGIDKVQELSIASRCSKGSKGSKGDSEATIQHEFMHALGFYHEQSRPDRDEHVKIHWNRINSTYCGAFVRCGGCRTTTAYDITSIMQYKSSSFACVEGQDTILKKSGQEIVPAKSATSSDVKKIKDYYCGGTDGGRTLRRG